MGKATKREPDRAPAFRDDEVIGEILERDPRVDGVLAGFGLPCSRCVVKDFETLAEGCRPLGIRTEDVIERLNALRP